MNLKLSLLGMVLAVCGIQLLPAQNVGVNGTGAAADASAMLDVAAGNKGLLIPRVALTGTNDVSTIATPATSLLVYNIAFVSDVRPGYYYWDGSQWLRLTNTSDDWSTTGNAGTNPTANFIGTSDAAELSIRTSGADRIRVKSNGDIGIGTITPSGRLNVDGAIRVGLIYPAGTGTYPGYGNRIFFSGGPAQTVYNSDNSDPLWMSRYNAAQDASELRLNLSDNCNSAPDAFAIQAGGSGCGAGTVYFRFQANGTAFKPGGGSWAALSDARLKRNVQDFDDGLAVIRQIRPVTFEYNGEAHTPDDGTSYIGVIAQEMQTAAPYMVTQHGEYLSVDPSGLQYVLVNAVQEQQDQIESLESQNQALSAEVAQLKAQMEALLNKVEGRDQ